MRAFAGLHPATGQAPGDLSELDEFLMNQVLPYYNDLHMFNVCKCAHMHKKAHEIHSETNNGVFDR